jgi:Mrp family chromosome partitioning ATPase
MGVFGCFSRKKFHNFYCLRSNCSEIAAKIAAVSLYLKELKLEAVEKFHHHFRKWWWNFSFKDMTERNTMPAIITIANQKGGVGKTTTTISVGHGLAQRGYRTLLVNVDPRANLPIALDCHRGKGIYKKPREHSV